MRKRGNNEGSIYRDKNGYWRGSVTLYSEHGKQKKKYFCGRTKKEVADKVSRTLNEIRNHTYIEPTAMTLGRVAADMVGHILSKHASSLYTCKLRYLYRKAHHADNRQYSSV